MNKTKKLENDIRYAFYASIVTILVTLSLVLIALAVGYLDAFNFSISLIEIVLMSILSYGIYKKSRFASTVFFIYFLLSKIVMTAAAVITGAIASIVGQIALGIVFLYFYFKGMVATYKLYKIKNKKLY